MVGVAPAMLVLRDALLAAGQGFLLALIYRLLRLLMGNKALPVALCDIALFVLGAVFYRSAATSIFASGTMRWYTAVGLLLGYALCTQILYSPLSTLHTALCKPFLWSLDTVWRPFCRNIAKKRTKRHSKKQIKHRKDLPNHAKVLYNSN
ncbi:MAG: spore cortex biosynthesis protein YabQ [Ruthenibacterium sp.]